MSKELVLVRTSERTSFKQCRQQWWWGYEERRMAKRDKPALRFGTLVHVSLAAYYKPGRRRGPHPAKTFVQLYKDELEAGAPQLYMKGDENTATRIEANEFGNEILKHYIEVYGKDDRYEIIQPEQSFQLDIHHPKTGKYLFTYVSQMDAVIKDLHTRKIGLFEHKTSATTSPFGAPLTLDEQASAYWTFGTMWLKATGKIPEDEDLDFMLYNFLRKAMPDTRDKNDEGLSLNKDGTVSKRQPPPYFRREYVMRGHEERVEVFRRALNEFREMQMVRDGKLAVYKAPGRHCGYCQFRDPCEVHEVGSDYEAIFDNMFTTWDPYEDHAEGLAEEEE